MKSPRPSLLLLAVVSCAQGCAVAGEGRVASRGPATAGDEDGTPGAERPEAYPADKWFGYASVWLDDVDGDGWHDLAVPSPEFSMGGVAPRGIVLILSGADGRVLRTVRPEAGESYFGFGLAPADDVDGDGMGELAVWAATTRPDGQRSGLVRVLSPVDGTVHWERRSAPGFTYVHGVERIDDADGDGTRDLSVWGDPPTGAGEGDARQTLMVLSGSDGGVLSERSIEGSQWFRITSVQAVEDFDGDGRDEFVLCSYEKDASRSVRRRVELRSGATGEVSGRVTVATAGALVGEVVDLDGDGRSELLLAGEGGQVRLPSRTEPVPLVPGEVLAVDLATLELRGTTAALARDSSRRPVSSLAAVGPGADGRRLLMIGSSEGFAGEVNAVDPVEGRWAWSLGGDVATERAQSDSQLFDYLGEYVAVDPAPDAAGRQWALTGTANPYWSHNHTVWCFDPLTGAVRFIVDAHGLYREAGL